ncbi:MAG: cupin domain-containing protein [Methylovulum sp.]|nr:cupin domain-containing protein [Methylovulum sp.]
MNHKTENPDQAEVFEPAELEWLLAAVVPPQSAAADGVRHQAIAGRLGQRMAHSIAEHAGLLTVRLKDGVWSPVKDGIRYKTLWRGGAVGNSVLIEFAAGAALPVHRHSWLEEGIVLRGGLQIGELELGLFDYHVAPAGSRHASIQSRQGALAFLRGTSLGDGATVLRELLGGLLPFRGGSAQTVFANDEGWQELGSGVFKKELYADGGMASCFYRLLPGATVPAHAHLKNEECMMLEGDVFLGDILLREGEYQLAPAGSAHGLAYTDVGALLFVRGAAG